MQPRVPLAPGGGPSPADSRRANAFGILDAVGNVAQWTATPFAARPDAAALNGSGPDGAGGVLAIRGGSWRCTPNELSLAWRRSVSATRRADDLGVRLVCEVVTENRVGG
jgi:formylglycine-generating enzyme required for sulfatase activity